MSYFVIKGPRTQGQYLCSLPGHSCPQWWHERSKANRFPDEESAWRWLEAVASSHSKEGSWFGRVIRVNTLRDWKSERAQLRAEANSWRAIAELRREELEQIKASAPFTSSAKESK